MSFPWPPPNNPDGILTEPPPGSCCALSGGTLVVTVSGGCVTGTYTLTWTGSGWSFYDGTITVGIALGSSVIITGPSALWPYVTGCRQNFFSESIYVGKVIPIPENLYSNCPTCGGATMTIDSWTP
jgi:hypothetical protein